MELSDGGSSDASDLKFENGKEVVKSPLGEDDSGTVLICETGNGNESFPNEPLQNVAAFSYASGSMTELFPAVHMKEKQVQFAEQHIPGAKIELCETVNAEAGPQRRSQSNTAFFVVKAKKYMTCSIGRSRRYQ